MSMNFIRARLAKIKAVRDARPRRATDGDMTFKEMEHHLAGRKGVRDPKALAAFIGRAHGKIP